MYYLSLIVERYEEYVFLADNENEAATKAENLILLDLRIIEYNKIVIILER